MFKKAFTLAEILIVIAVIGVVSAMTLPNLNDNYKDEQNVAKLRKVYNDFDLSYNKLVAEYGTMANWPGGYTKRVPLIMKNFKAINCGTKANTACYPSGSTYDADTFTKYQLEDGTGISINSGSSSSPIAIYVALEGSKSHPKLGKNIFGFIIDDANGLYPMGKGEDRNASTNKLKKFTGIEHYATNWVIVNGNMDYLKCPDSLVWDKQITCP